MPFYEMINKINDDTKNLDFVSARKYIENNREELEKQKHLLNKNAREILNFVTEIYKNGYQPLNRKEIVKIRTINMYASQFNVRAIKMIIEDSPNLLMRKDCIDLLDVNAKVILEGLGVLENE